MQYSCKKTWKGEATLRNVASPFDLYFEKWSREFEIKQKKNALYAMRTVHFKIKISLAAKSELAAVAGWLWPASRWRLA